MRKGLKRVLYQEYKETQEIAPLKHINTFAPICLLSTCCCRCVLATIVVSAAAAKSVANKLRSRRRRDALNSVHSSLEHLYFAELVPIDI